MLMIVCAAVSTATVPIVGICMMLLSPNWTLWSLNRSINFSAFSTVTTIRLHTGLVLVIMYHWNLPSLVIIFIDLESYGLITEECVFALTDPGRLVFVL